MVFSIDYRLGLPPRWEDATGDVKCAVGWVEENAGRYGVDPDGIALLGQSFGGYPTLLAAYTEGDPRLPPSCDVSDTGVEAVAAFYSSTASRVRRSGRGESRTSPARCTSSAGPASMAAMITIGWTSRPEPSASPGRLACDPRRCSTAPARQSGQAT